MGMKTIELDIAADLGCLNDAGEYEEFSIERCTKKVAESAAKHYVKVRLVEETGPAGGNPLYAFTGSDEALREYLRDEYCAGESTESVDFYMEHAEEADASSEN